MDLKVTPMSMSGFSICLHEVCRGFLAGVAGTRCRKPLLVGPVEVLARQLALAQPSFGRTLIQHAKDKPQTKVSRFQQ